MGSSFSAPNLAYAFGTLAQSHGGTGLASQNPKFKVDKAGNAQVLATGSNTQIVWEHVQFDTQNRFLSNVYTPNIAGLYLFEFSFQTETLPDGCVIIAGFRMNGSLAVGQSMLNLTTGASGDCGASGSCILSANGTTDYFDVFINQASGGDVNLRGQVYLTSFGGELLP